MSNCGSASQPLEALAERLRLALSSMPALGAVLRFDLGEDGTLLVDARRGPPLVSVGPGEAACTLSMRRETLERILRGEIDGTATFMQGGMTISGEVELAVRLNRLLTQAVSGTDSGAPSG